MSKFVTRVELHGVHHDATGYLNLHAQMAVRGFSRTIPGVTIGGAGGTWHMPPAEYYIDATLTIEQVRDRATNAAVAAGYPVGTHSAILVTEGESCWTGLSKAA